MGLGWGVGIWDGPIRSKVCTVHTVLYSYPRYSQSAKTLDSRGTDSQYCKPVEVTVSSVNRLLTCWIRLDHGFLNSKIEERKAKHQ